MKVYIVMSSYGSYEDYYKEIEGVFTDLLIAQDLKLKIENDIERRKNIVCPVGDDFENMTEEECRLYDDWYMCNDIEKAREFNKCWISEPIILNTSLYEKNNGRE